MKFHEIVGRFLLLHNNSLLINALVQKTAVSLLC
jgi:hypothetical protein